MKTAEECLKEYMANSKIKNNFSSQRMAEIISKYGLGALLVNELYYLDSKKSLIHLCMIAKQKELNKIIQSELKLLTDNGKKMGIKVIPLKGVVLAEELYMQPETRISSDIDVLTDINDFSKFVKLCKNIGYVLKDGEEITDNLIQSYIKDEYREHHFWCIKREIIIGQKIYSVYLEIHTDIILKDIFCIDFNDLIISNALKRSYVINTSFADNVWKFEKLDTFIYLHIHFLQHFFRDILNGFVNGKICTQIKLNLVHDIAKYYDKYKDDINWEILRARIFEMNIVNEIAFLLRLWGVIYPDRVSDIYIEKLLRSAPKKRGFTSAASGILANIDTNELLFGNFVSVIRYVTMQIQSESINLKVSKKTERSDYFDIDFLFSSTHLVCCNKYKKDVDCSLLGNMSWNSEYLNICLKMNAKEVFFTTLSDQHNVTSFEQQDYVAIYFTFENVIQGKPFIRRLVIKPVYENDKIVLKIQNDYAGNNGQELWEIGNTEYYVNKAENNYNIIANIPWIRLEINPRKGLRIGFDVRMYHYEMESKKMIELAYANPYRIWHDPSNYVRIMLID